MPRDPSRSSGDEATVIDNESPSEGFWKHVNKQIGTAAPNTFVTGNMPADTAFMKAAQNAVQHGEIGVIPVPDVVDRGIYKDINNLKAYDPEAERLDAEEAEKKKYHDGISGQIAKSKKFEAATISVILFNAMVIGYDIDFTARWGKPDNLYDGPGQFIFLENFFAIFFSFEILVRLTAYKRTVACLWDMWFVFDAVLVIFMVAETWILPFWGSGSPLGQLSILRLLRLLRITRMAKLMRAFPELMMIIKGISAASRAVVWTAILLVIITYTWAIMFTNEYHQGLKPDESDDIEEVEELFGSMGKSFFSLLIMGTILDDVTFCTDIIRGTESMPMLLMFIVYILINSFTMMNMLVGILVEVVSKTAEREKERLLEEHVRESIKDIFDNMDKDGNDLITKREFQEMKRHKKVMKALNDLEIKEKEFEMYVTLLFENEEGEASGGESKNKEDPSIGFEDMCNMILRLRPGNAVQTLDFQAFKQLVAGCTTSVKDRIRRVETLIDSIVTALTGGGGDTSVPLLDNPLNRNVGIDNKGTSDATIDFVQMGNWGAPAVVKREESTQRINVHMLSQLERTASSEIIAELQRRLGMASLEETGVPLSMMDEELQQRVCAAEAFQTIGVPQTDPAWSKETHEC